MEAQMTRYGHFGIAVAAAVGIVTSSHAQERFDYQVREDMFRAFAGNAAALKSAMATIEEKLLNHPDHAEALVWRGAARTWMAGRALEAGDTAGAKAMAAGGGGGMGRAVALGANYIWGLVPRAGGLVAVVRHIAEGARVA